MNDSQSIVNNSGLLDYAVNPNIMINYNNEIIEYYIKGNTDSKVSICEYLTIEALNKLMQHTKVNFVLLLFEIS